MGYKQTITDVETNQYHNIKEPDVTSVAENGADVPATFSLEQNYPNPINSNTVLNYSIQSRSNVKLDIYDINGRKIISLIDQIQAPGYHSTVWNGRDQFGNFVATGVYFYRLVAGDVKQTRKLMYIK